MTPFCSLTSKAICMHQWTRLTARLFLLYHPFREKELAELSMQQNQSSTPDQRSSRLNSDTALLGWLSGFWHVFEDLDPSTALVLRPRTSVSGFHATSALGSCFQTRLTSVREMNLQAPYPFVSLCEPPPSIYMPRWKMRVFVCLYTIPKRTRKTLYAQDLPQIEGASRFAFSQNQSTERESIMCSLTKKAVEVALNQPVGIQQQRERTQEPNTEILYATQITPPHVPHIEEGRRQMTRRKSISDHSIYKILNAPRYLYYLKFVQYLCISK